MAAIEFNKENLRKLHLLDERDNILLSKEDIELLEQGKQTNEMLLKNIVLRDKSVDLNASLSADIVKGKANIRIHPYYKELENQQLLTEQEKKYISENNGVHSKVTNVSGDIITHGSASYKFDRTQQDSYYVSLKTDVGTETVWGVDLKDKMKDHRVGENVNIKYTGKERVEVSVPYEENGVRKWRKIETDRNTFSVKPYDEKNDLRNEKVLIEYNNKKKSFEIVDSSSIPKVKAINGKKLSSKEQEALANGEEIEVGDNKLKFSPKEQTFVQRNNKQLLIASIMLDGGMSYIIIKAVEMIKAQDEKNQQKASQLELAKNIVDKQYINDLENLKNEINEKISRTDNKEELNDIKDFIGKEIETVENKSYNESDLEQRPINDDDVDLSQSLDDELSNDYMDDDLEMGVEEEQTRSRGRGR